MTFRKKTSTKQRVLAFLKAYAETCDVVAAASKAGISRQSHYRWLRTKPQYAALFAQTRQLAAEYLESELVKRATKGWLEPVFYQGAQCGSVRRFDGSTGMALLRGLMPERYGTQRQEISGPQGTPIQAKITVVYIDPKHDGDGSGGDAGHHRGNAPGA